MAARGRSFAQDTPRSLGYIKVPIENIQFDYPLARKRHRPASQKNINRLKGLFRSIGCQNGEEQNAIEGVVFDVELQEAMSEQGLDLLPLATGHGDIPLLNVRVKAFNGLHRIMAALGFLDADDRWWLVRLFEYS